MSYQRPAGTTRFQTRSAAKLGLPSAWLDSELDAIYTVLNSMILSVSSSEWALYNAVVTYVAGTTFTVAGDQTDTFHVKRKVQASLAGTLVYSKVSAVTYSAMSGVTTVQLADAVLAATLTNISYGIIDSVVASSSISAEMVPFAGGILLTATDVQGAIEELVNTTIPAGSVTHATTADSATVADKVTDGVNVIKTKIIEIGDWNMDSTVNVSIAHGLTYAKIIGVGVTIRNDADSSRSPIDYALVGSDGPPDGRWTVDATTVNLTRRTGGVYDAAQWDSTSFNRGWIIVTYLE